MLVLDEWSSPSHYSIWNFTILTPTRKKYIIQLFNLSADSYISDFIIEKIEVIINHIGLSKFMTVVNNNGTNVRKARKIIQTKYPCIKNIRCISHCINLISCDIVQHSFANKILKKVNILALFFRNNTMAGRNSS